MGVRTDVGRYISMVVEAPTMLIRSIVHSFVHPLVCLFISSYVGAPSSSFFPTLLPSLAVRYSISLFSPSSDPDRLCRCDIGTDPRSKGLEIAVGPR